MVYGWTFFPESIIRILPIYHFSYYSDSFNMKNEWIYYLNLAPIIDQNFILLDQAFKKHDLSLIPVFIEDLLNMARSQSYLNLVVCIDKASKFNYFNKKIRKLIKYLLRRENISFYILSSFESLNDRQHLVTRKNYFFTNLPISLTSYSSVVSEIIKLKEEGQNNWPGAKRRVYPAGEIF